MLFQMLQVMTCPRSSEDMLNTWVRSLQPTGAQPWTSAKWREGQWSWRRIVNCKVTNVTILLQKGRGRAQTDEWRQASQDDADITEPGGRLAGVRLQRHSKYSDGDWSQLEH